ncbi:MAG: YHYH protein [Salinibacterium sp.]|nr:YHYH protein [Salinibacterium sp.]
MSTVLSTRALALPMLVVSAMLTAGCTAAAAPDATPTSDPTPAAVAASPAPADIPTHWSAVVDLAAIPLGDDAVSSAPATDFIFSCKTNFSGRGPVHTGPWIDYENDTWNSTTKVVVTGNITWPTATYVESVEGEQRVLTSQDVPVDDPTGTFPIAADDPAFAFDRNPNSIGDHAVELRMPLNPTTAAVPSCVAMGAIGMITNGVFIYNALDGSGGDAAAHEAQDLCNGHPDGADDYHYHDIPSCILDVLAPTGSTLVGYALDGYGIYVERDSLGNLPTNADLDECHGRTSTVLFNGIEQEMYHYSATLEFPFTVGCYRGTPGPVPSHG